MAAQLAVIPMPSAKEADVSSFRRNLGVCGRQAKISSEPKVQVIMAMAENNAGNDFVRVKTANLEVSTNRRNCGFPGAGRRLTPLMASLRYLPRRGVGERRSFPPNTAEHTDLGSADRNCNPQRREALPRMCF